MKDFDWKSVLFTDEKSFWLGQPSAPCWQQLDDRVIEEVERYTPKVHVWGAIGYDFKTQLLFPRKYDRKTLSKNYIQAPSSKNLRS